MPARSSNHDPRSPRRSANPQPTTSSVGLRTRCGWLTDRWWRHATTHRFDALALLGPVRDKRVLEVGCGHGRYLVELAARGAREAVGVDPVAARLGRARSAAAVRGVMNRCRFTGGDFLHAELSGPFDACIAIGYFDLLPDPIDHLRRMVALTRGDLLASFPQRYTLRALPRSVCQRLCGRRLRQFTMAEVHRLAVTAGLEDVQIYATGGDLLLHARSRGERRAWRNDASTTAHRGPGEPEPPPGSRIKCTGQDTWSSRSDGLHAG